MRLSAILFFGKRPYGFKYRGKHRVILPIKLNELGGLKADYERTEKNMLYLRHPYLTVEQSKGHSAEKRANHQLNFISRIVQERNKKFAKHTTVAETLIHLRVKEAWD